jgi:hypothetical protein
LAGLILGGALGSQLFIRRAQPVHCRDGISAAAAPWPAALNESMREPAPARIEEVPPAEPSIVRKTRAPRPAPNPSRSPKCPNPPWTFDKQGNKIYIIECL